MSTETSFVVTLEIDAENFQWLDGLRQQHFPAKLNLLPAHLTLFHKLNSDQIETMNSFLESQSTCPVELHFTGWRFLGRGVAIDIRSPDLLSLRARLASLFGNDLTRQDHQTFKPHVTIQNKVEPEQAKQLLSDLAQDFQPERGRGEGILVWRYLGGPWSLHGKFSFGAKTI